jgi:hypothetical protein
LCPADITPPDWFELQFGGVQRKVIDAAAIDSGAPELGATVRAAAASGHPTPERARAR